MAEINYRSFKPLNILIFDTEMDFANDMKSFLELNHYIGQVEIFDSFQSNKPIENDVDVVLVDIDLLFGDSRFEEFEKLGIKKTIILVKQMNDLRCSQLRDRQFELVYKYGPDNILLETILQLPSRFTTHHKYRPEIVDDPAKEGSARMFVVHSPKGGTGKSTVAVNLAFNFAKKGIKTLLVDYAIYGNIGSMLKITHRGKGLSSIITLLEQDSGVVSKPRFLEVIRENVSRIDNGTWGVDVLISASPIKMESLSVKDTQALFNALIGLDYQVIIVDTSSELCQRNIELLLMADKLVIMATPELCCGWNLLLLKDVLSNLSVAKSKICFAVNKCSKDLGFYMQDFEAVLGYEIITEIPDCYKQVTAYNNKGVVLATKNLPINRYFRMLANSLYPVFDSKEITQSWVSKVFG